MGADDARAAIPNRLVYSTDDLASDTDDARRREAWLAFCERTLRLTFEMTRVEDRPFSGHLDLVWLDETVLVTARSTATQLKRTQKHVNFDGADYFVLHLNEGEQLLRWQNARGEMLLRNGMLGLSTVSEPTTYDKSPGATTRNALISRSALSELIRSPDDHVPRALNPHGTASKLLKDYMKLLLRPADIEADPAVSTHASRTLHDLVALALGADRDAAELAKMRGGRTAKLQLILDGIKSSFDDPGFSEHALAAKLGIAPRTIRDLLYETGITFSERVLELRLQKALTMLTEPRCKHMRVADIAYACGFNEVPYFNRRFRRRFGAPPTHIRG